MTIKLGRRGVGTLNLPSTMLLRLHTSKFSFYSAAHFIDGIYGCTNFTQAIPKYTLTTFVRQATSDEPSYVCEVSYIFENVIFIYVEGYVLRLS